MKLAMILIAACVLAVPALTASAVAEVEEGPSLWNAADAIADASETTIPSLRTIVYAETDGEGNALYTESASVSISQSHGGRYLTLRESGGKSAFDILDRYTDGLVLTPFNDNLYDVEYTYTGTDESVEGTTAAVYTFSMAYESALAYYNPNYGDIVGSDGYNEEESVIGWDFDDDDFDGTITGKIWLDKVSGNILQMETTYVLDGENVADDITLTQVVSYTEANGATVPSVITISGTSENFERSSGSLNVTDFLIIEQQSHFQVDEKFAKGESVI